MSARSSLAERAALSGQDLGLLSVQFGRRKGAPPMVCLTDRDLRLMALLLDVNYLLTSQLVLLGWGSSSTRAAQKRLKVLHDSGYLDRFRPVRRIGSAEWIYRLSARGWKALASQDLMDGNARFKPTAFTSISYTAHDLQLSALILRIALAAGGSYADGLIDTMPFTWQGPRSGRIAWQGPRARRSDRDWRHDFDLDGEDERERDVNDELGRDGHKNVERSAAAQLPLGTRLYKCESRSGYLEPDATLIGGSGEDRFAVLIEYDRTDRPHKQIDRLRRYDAWSRPPTRCSAPGTALTTRARARAPIRRESGFCSQVASASTPATGPWTGRRACRQNCGGSRTYAPRARSSMTCRRCSRIAHPNRAISPSIPAAATRNERRLPEARPGR